MLFRSANCPDDALIIAGQAYNPELGDRIKVTVVATGFERAEVTGAEVDSEGMRRRFTAMETSNNNNSFSPTFPTQKQPSAQPPVEEKKVTSQPTEAEAITVNRWQDLQQQLGKRTPSNDYSVPAVLRYQRNDDDENK